MIRRRVSAVIRLRDSFQGCALEGHGLQCLLDGIALAPQRKEGGYLVLTDLSDGRHTLLLTLHGYQPEQLTLDITAGTLWEGSADMKPGAGYPFGRNAVALCLHFVQQDKPLSQVSVWLASAEDAPLKLAQTKATAETRQLRLFQKNAQMLPLPANFIVADEKNPELVTVLSMEKEEGILAKPLRYSHTRGKALYPAQQYHTDAAGSLHLLLHEAGKLAVLHGEHLKIIQADSAEVTVVLE